MWICGSTKTLMVLSRKDASNFTYEHPYIHIAIYSSKETPVPLAESPGRRDVLSLMFDDWDKEKGHPEGSSLFSKEQAVEIKKFLELYPGIRHIVVNCTMGVSRSAAVAAAISKAYNWDDRVFFTRFIPNRHVFRTLLEELLENPVSGETQEDNQ